MFYINKDCPVSKSRTYRDNGHRIQEEAHEDANVIWGWVIDPSMKDEARVTVIATGFEEGVLQATPSVERRIAQGGGRGRLMGVRGGKTANTGPMVSGLNPEDYDFPVFFNKYSD